MKPKKDTSLYVPQRDKFKGSLNIRQLPWTERQKEFFKLALDKQTKIIFVNGPAGSTKTIMAVYAALEMLKQAKVSDIMYIRSAVESADQKLGYLPGEVDDKMAYYGIPLLEKLEELLTGSEITNLKKEKRVTVQPVNYVRGQSWNAKVAIVDEAQNLTRKEIFTIITRVGKFSKCFVLADPMQSDINGKSGGFQQLAALYDKEKYRAGGIHYFELGKADIKRDELTALLIEAYEELLAFEAKRSETKPSGH